MNKTILKISTILIVIGLIVGGIGLGLGGKTSLVFGPTGLTLPSSNNLNINETLDAFHSIELDLDYLSDLKIIESDHFGIEASYNTSNGELHYNVIDGVLKVSQAKVHQLFGFDFLQASSTLTLHIPSDVSLEMINLKTEVSNITLNNRVVNKLYIHNEFGKTTLENISGQLLDLNCESGKINLDNLNIADITVQNAFGNISIDKVVTNDFKVIAKSGKIKLNDVKAEDLEVNNEFGKTDLSAITANSLQAKNESGSFSIKDSLVTSSKIKNDFGSVTVEYSGNLGDFNYNLATDFGSVKVNGNKQGSNVAVNNTGNYDLTVKCESGSVDVIIN